MTHLILTHLIMPQRLVLIHTGKCADKGPFDKTHSKLPPLTGKEPLGCLLGVIVLDGPYKREDHPKSKQTPMPMETTATK